MSFPGNEESDGDKIVLNVGGKRHETFLSTLQTIPDTRLAWLADNEKKNNNRNNEQAKVKEVFFDRHPEIFGLILNYYRTGKLHAPRDLCGPLFEDELIFWGIEEKEMEACCWPYYNQHRDAEKNLKDFVGPQFDDSEDEENDLDSSYTSGVSSNSRWHRIRGLVWTTLDDANSSRRSKVYAFVSLFMILFSVIAMCLATVTELERYKNEIDTAEYVFCAWFSLELTLRFIFCPSRIKLLKEAMTWVDIISLLPYYINLIPGKQGTLGLLRAIRLVRVFRIFRFFAFTSGLQIIVQSLKASLRELLLLLIILIIPVILFSSFLYEFEKDNGKHTFRNIPEAFWWAIITMTTVGYGDLVPTTPVGKVIGSVCAICGVLIVALPVSVIGNNFSTFYEHAQARLCLPRKKRRLIMGDANRLCHLQGQSNSSAYESKVNSCRASPVIVEDGPSMDNKSPSNFRKYHRRSRGTIYGAGQVYIGHRPKRSVVIGNGVVTRATESKVRVESNGELPVVPHNHALVNSAHEGNDSNEQIETKTVTADLRSPKRRRKSSTRSLGRNSSTKLKGLKTTSWIELKRSSQDLELMSPKMKRPMSARSFQSRVSPEKYPKNLSSSNEYFTSSSHFLAPIYSGTKPPTNASDSRTVSIENGIHLAPSLTTFPNGCILKESSITQPSID